MVVEDQQWRRYIRPVNSMPTTKYILAFLKIDKWRSKLHLISMWEQVVYFVDGMVGDLLKDAF